MYQDVLNALNNTPSISNFRINYKLIKNESVHLEGTVIPEEEIEENLSSQDTANLMNNIINIDPNHQLIYAALVSETGNSNILASAMQQKGIDNLIAVLEVVCQKRR